MRKFVFVFILILIYSACYSKICYRVLYNGELIEERNYEDGSLKSIVAYNLSNTKDSVVYDGEIKSYHYNGKNYHLVDPFPYSKYYYPNFDKSICNNYIYSVIKSRVLLENIIWSLASIDNEVLLDISSKRIIKESASNYSIEYKNLNVQCQLYGFFETYNNEKLRSLKIVIKNGLLIKILLMGEETNQVVLFDYSNNILQKEKIYYYKKGEYKPIYVEEYSIRTHKGPNHQRGKTNN